jgi:hypothetical protein
MSGDGPCNLVHDHKFASNPTQPEGGAALKACPFCGAEVQIRQYKGGYRSAYTKCLAEGPPDLSYVHAVVASNTRTPIPPTSPEREAVYRAVDRVIELRAGLYTLPVKIDFVARHDANEALKYAIDVAAAHIVRKESSNAD